MPNRKIGIDEAPDSGDQLSPDDRRAPKPNEGFLVVGIGASAGGIGALKEFFENVKEDSGVAYVVILHLSPDHDSQLASVLQVASKIPVAQVSKETTVQPNHVYVVPPNRSLRMSDGKIVVKPLSTEEERRAPVDIFFRTLAESHHSRAVGVVLSGTGANGSMGIKRVKENGGVAFVQNPREAEFNEMPRNSIATGLIDAIVSVAEIPDRILLYKKSLGTVEIPVENIDRPNDQQVALRDVFTQLRVRTGHDFSNYKRATMMRRIERRISVRGLPSLTDYAAFIHENPDEPHALLRDLLISVTNFFRDRGCWDYMEAEVVPRILEAKKTGESVRIWCAGCATGEEAYSFAMLFADKMLGAVEGVPVQIFATDIDAQAISAARDGIYTLNDAADVPPERLRRFFTKEGSGYRVRRELREMILFANHNALKDPPFSHLDLVSCRNMLIYLNNVAQERVMETFHFALKPGGYLFLGSSESVDQMHDLYANVSKENHVYQARHVTSRAYPIPDSTPTFNLTPQPEDIKESIEKRPNERITYTELHQQLLEHYAPPSVVVNEEYDIVHLSERAGKYLQVGGGELSKNLLKLVHPDLSMELRTALYQAIQRSTNVDARGLKVTVDGRTETINILVRPVLGQVDTARGFALVIFEPTGDEVADGGVIYTSPEPLARQLEEELIRSKAQLRSSLEQAEVQTEELRASNEELQAMNEELRSAAEELETSKEELQSINEELVTVNQELKVKIEELSQSNNNFQNLINSTDIATIFLDRGFRINLFSPAACAIFNLLPSDIGRPLTDITTKLDYDGMVRDVDTVVDTLQNVEREVRTSDGAVYMMRVLPYRTAEDVINGAVITFFDVTERKLAEELLQEHADELTRFNDAMIGREQRMIELKNEINTLSGRLNEPARYSLELEDQT